MFKNRKAFTLAEILIALLILAVIMAMAIPTFSNLITVKRQQLTANSYMKVHNEIANALEEYSLINYAPPETLYGKGLSNIIDELKPYLRIIDETNKAKGEFTLYDGTVIKIGKSTTNIADPTENSTTGEFNEAATSNQNLVFAYQRPNTFVAQTVYTKNGHAYFACKANCNDSDGVYKVMTKSEVADKDGNKDKTNYKNLEVLTYNGGVTPPVSTYEDEEK